MAECTVPGCCCCCSLRQGTLILGWLSLVLGIVNVGTQANYSVQTGDALGWVNFTLSICNILMAVCLLTGVYQMKPGLLMLWVYTTTVLLFIGIILAIVLMAVSGVIAIGIVLIIPCALQIYYIVVVRSYAIEMSEPPHMVPA